MPSQSSYVSASRHYTRKLVELFHTISKIKKSNRVKGKEKSVNRSRCVAGTTTH